MKEDFEKLPGEVKISGKGRVRTKKFPNGDTAVERTLLGPERGKDTIEIQSNVGKNIFKIKIRYE